MKKFRLGSFSNKDIVGFVERQLYLTVDQFNIAKDSTPLCLKQSEMVVLVQLNIRAANLASKSASFSSSKFYLDTAWDILKSLTIDNNNNPWQEGKYFKLCVEVMLKRAKTEYSLGNVKAAEDYCDQVMKYNNDVETLEWLAACLVKLNILTGQAKTKEALDICLATLEQIGCPLTTNSLRSQIQVRLCLKKTKSKHIPTADEVKNMAFLSDKLKIKQIDLIQKAASLAYSLNDIDLYILTSCRWIQSMKQYGLTSRSGSAIASFANIIMHVYGDFVLGTELAQLALAIQHRLNNKYTSTQTLNTSNRNVLGWVKPLKSTLPYHLEAFENGLISGNIEGAFVGILFSYWVRLNSGLPLAELEADCRKHIPVMRKMGHNMYADLSSTIWQTALNLMNAKENTYTLTGTAMDEDEYMKKAFKHSMGLIKSFNYVYFGEFYKGAKDALSRGCSYEKAFIGAGYGLEPFYRGICLYVMARKKNGKPKYKNPANKIRSKLRSWVEKGCLNLEGPLKILDAENAALSGDLTSAAENYEKAIELSIQGGFHQNAGLACERYAQCMMDKSKNISKAQLLLEQAIHHYRNWGALHKVKLLERAADDIRNSCFSMSEKSYGSSDSLTFTLSEISNTELLLDGSSGLFQLGLREL